MNIYPLVRPLLFALDAERAHDLTLSGLRLAAKTGLLPRPAAPADGTPRRVMGLDFPNAVGLAAGLDKNASCIDGLAALGFGFIEVGTVTPRPQPGNPRPRLFRLRAAEGIINRFGFNNQGVHRLLENVRAARYKGILGINIGKNFDTPNARAVEDYLYCLREVYPHASYVTVNISSPNTRNLRDLQQGEALAELLAALKEAQRQLAQVHEKYVPIALKIAPDLTEPQVHEIADLLLQYAVDGVIATNTTLARDDVAGQPHAEEAGGLSGRPVRDRSTRVIGQLAQRLQGRVPIIGVGGIFSGADARAKLDAGASLVQLYSGLIYRGPALVREVRRAVG